ncbi:MAG: hypothetical protein OHK0039_46850 [Bacteroidia bacterium]
MEKARVLDREMVLVLLASGDPQRRKGVLHALQGWRYPFRLEVVGSLAALRQWLHSTPP